MGGEHGSQGVAAGQCGPCTQGADPSPAHRKVRGVISTADKRWVPSCGAWRADPGRCPLLAVRAPEETGVKSSASKNACGGSLNHQRSRAPLLSDAKGKATPPPHCSRLPSVPAPPCQALGRAVPGLHFLSHRFLFESVPLDVRI